MEKPTTPINEQDRLDALDSYEILDTAEEHEFNDIVVLASQICGTDIALISLIDKNRQWFKSSIGLNTKETARDISFCGHAINIPNDIFIVDDARLDKRFSDNPLVTGEPHIVFYAGSPLIDDNGFALGTICLLHPAPKTLNENQITALKILGRKVILLLNNRKKSIELIREKAFLIESINFSSPFFLIVDKNNFILEFGDNYKKTTPEIKKGKLFSDYFVLESLVNFESLLASNSQENKLFFYKSIDEKQRFKCSVKKYNKEALLILSVPVINTIYTIKNLNISLNDFPKHDYIAEYIFLQQAATKGLSDLKIMNDNLNQKNKLLELSKSSLINANTLLEDKVNERTKKIRNLALFPEHNPNPVFEFDYENMVINYLNPAGKLVFFKNGELTSEDLFKILSITDEVINLKKTVKKEIEFKSEIYERNIFFIQETNTLRVYLHNITDTKKYQNELSKKNAELENTLAQIVNLQNDIIKKEKMATLGLLIAGIAHEINTPLGAIKASNDNLIYSIKIDLIDKIRELDVKDVIDSIELYFLNKQINTINRSSRHERFIIKKIEQELQLKHKNISNTNFYARKINELGFDHLDSSLEKYIKHKNSERIFTFAVNLLLIIKSTNTISIAIDKASKVVSSLNNFSHGNALDEITIFNLKENLDSVLTILWNKIKQGAKIINHIPDNVFIKGNQEELAQVWTNIINNALQASKNKCQIELYYSSEKETHIITFKNNGPEIPKDIINNIFDAFFTTKKQGEGTGLGLNIVKKIIEKNKGTIECISNSIETKFTIFLPIHNE